MVATQASNPKGIGSTSAASSNLISRELVTQRLSTEAAPQPTTTSPRAKKWWMRPAFLLPTMVLVPLAFYHIREYSQTRRLEEPHIQMTPAPASATVETLEFHDIGLAAIPHPTKVSYSFQFYFDDILILLKTNKPGGMGEDFGFISRRALGENSP
jgi:hypothetical protein